MQEPQVNPYAPPVASSLVPAEPATASHQLAERGTRLAAALLDGALYAAIAVPGLTIMGVVAVAGSSGGDIGPQNFLAFGPLLALAGMLVLAAYQWYLVATTGQSLAKRWLHIRIVMQNGSLPGFVHGVLLRSWVMALAGQIPLVGFIVTVIVDPLLIFGDERRCLHDLVAGTIVIQA